MAGPYSTTDERNYIGVGLQSARGTAVTPTVFVPYVDGPKVSHGMKGDGVFEAGTGPYAARTQKESHDPTGGFSLAWRPKTMAQLIAWFLGADTAASGGSGYDHTAVPAHTPLYLTIERCIADEIVERFVDAVFTKVTIKQEGGKDLMADFEWSALTAAWTGSASSDAYETGVSGSTAGAPYRGNEATYTIDGAGATDVASWELEVERAYDAPHLSAVTGLHQVKHAFSGKVKTKQLALATTPYRTVAYGSSGGTAPNKNFNQNGSFLAVYDNGLSSTNARLATISAAGVDWVDVSLTDADPKGETVYVEREGIITKESGSAFFGVISRTADSSAYI